MRTMDVESVSEIAAPSVAVVRQQQCLQRDREVQDGVGRILACNACNKAVQRQVLGRLWPVKVVPLKHPGGFDDRAEVAGGEPGPRQSRALSQMSHAAREDLRGSTSLIDARSCP